MANRFIVTKNNQQAGVERMLSKLDEMVADPGFVPAYQIDPVEFVESENERLFGALGLESLGLFYTCKGYQELANSRDGTSLLAQGLSHYVLAFKIYVADLHYVTANGIENFVDGTDVCLLGFARAISYGQVSLADWWAEQLHRISSIDPSYLCKSLIDAPLVKHLLLIAICWREKRWCRPEEVDSSLGVYKPLWELDIDADPNPALDECAYYHLSEAFSNDYSPFGSMPYGPYPLELLSWVRLYERVASKRAVPINHPLFQNPVTQHPGPIPTLKNEWLEKVSVKVRDFYGDFWPEIV
jgi:hypothetical protein